MAAQTEQIDLAALINTLLAAERGNAFAFLAEAEPYMGRSSTATWRRIEQIVTAGQRRQGEMAEMLDQLGVSATPSTLARENQYLAFLNIDFILAKLIEAKQQSIRRYEEAINRIAGSDSAGVLARHLDEHRRELEILTALSSPAKASAANPSQN